MISLVISSANKKLLAKVKKNIDSTIGVPYEILSYNNSNAQKSICEIYNNGANNAIYEIICYLHEDLEIKTSNWGIEVVRLFNENKFLGIVGVAGSAYKSFIPSGWGCNVKELTFVHYIQSYKHSKISTEYFKMGFDNSKEVKVVCVDGMWFCTLKNIALKYRFDEVLLKGFHCYDIDYCLNVGQNYDIMVTSQVLMEHFSEGGYNKCWLKDTLKLQKKWKNTLPRTVIEVEPKQKLIIEKRAFRWLTEKLIDFGFSYKYNLDILIECYNKDNINYSLFLKLKVQLFNNMFLKKSLLL